MVDDERLDRERLGRVGEAARRSPGLRLLLLHGSRARQDHSPGSDWDFGYLADDGFDHLRLVADVSAALGTDRVDVVDLARASALLRFKAAAEGRCLYEAGPASHVEFALEATLFWCDAEAVIRRAADEVLAGSDA